MKILNVYFKNINSLVGESRIDFDKAPIADAGVFAITGPNGSGKSSILDAITLALYGETFRFNKPAENVMTKNTGGCFAQAEFLVDGKKYRSSWQVAREGGIPEGEVMAAQMQLMVVNGEEQVLAEEVHKVLSQNADITGMDFRRFTRSIMLAQGDFSAFLNALDTERLDILERIISNDIYADYKQQLRGNNEQAEHELTELKTRLSSVALLSDGQREAADLDLADQQLSYAELKQEKADLLQLQASLQDLQKLKQGIDQLEGEQAKDQQQLGEIQVDLQKISESGEVLQFKDSLQNTHETSTSIEQGKLQQQACQQELQKIQDKLSAEEVDEAHLATLPKLDAAARQKNISDLSTQEAQIKADQQAEGGLLNAFEVQLPEKQQTLSTIDSWLIGHQKDQVLVENMPDLGRLKSLRNRSIEIQKQLKTYNKAHKNSSSASSKNQGRLAVIEKEIAGGKKSLEVLQQEMEFIADGHSLDEVASLQAEQKERVANFVELFNLAKVHRKLDKKGASKRYSHLDKTRLEKLLDAKNQQIESAQNIQKILDKGVYREQLTIKLSEDRDKLEYDTPCSLCGSLEHPYTKSLPELLDSRKALSDQVTIVKSLETEAKKLTHQLASYTKIEDKNKAHAEQLNRIQAEWLTLCTRLNAVSDKFNITSLGVTRERIKKEKQELNEINTLIQRYKVKNKEIAKREVWAIKKQASLEKGQAKQKGLDESGQGRPRAMVDFETELAANMQEESALTKLVSTQLSELGEKLPDSGREDSLYDLLSRRRQDFQSYELRQTSLQTEIKQISDKVTASSELLQRHNEKLLTIHDSIGEQECALLYFSGLDKQEQLVKFEQTVARLESEVKQIGSVMQLKCQQSAYESLDEVQDLLDLHELQGEKQALKSELQHRLASYPAKIEAFNKQLDAERVHVSGAETIEGVVIQLRDKTVQMEIAAQEVVTLEKTLAEQQLLLENNKQLLQGIEEQKTRVQQLEMEQEQLDKEPEGDFRRRVQKDMADKLLTSANRFLDKINGRYHVSMRPSEMGIALEVTDSKQNNSKRALKSLSGGEAFVVSLALALGLSEIANNGRAINSLFIDEGFGSLDAETLYTVVSTLEGLKEQGKTVGIISHVDGIKQRIKTQVELVKQANGMSRIVVQKREGDEVRLKEKAG